MQVVSAAVAAPELSLGRGVAMSKGRPSPGPGYLPAIQALQTRRGRVSFMLSGDGAPAILLFSGAGVSLQGWETLYPGIESLGTVFGWNRFGMQGSDAPGERQTGAGVIGTLRELLSYAGVPPPYVLVAHSLGGLFANLFARLHPAEVAGVLFLEATHPDEGELLKKHEPQLVAALGRMLALPEAFFEANVHAELASVEETAREIACAGDFPEVPVRVVTGGLTPKSALDSPGAIGAKRAHQQELARLSPLGEQVIAQKSGHFPQLTEPELVLEVLGRLVEDVKAELPRG
jgi:pimeloyl-ACP methyl ester carboxylesterase